jgi:hypothetical protein
MSVYGIEPSKNVDYRREAMCISIGCLEMTRNSFIPLRHGKIGAGTLHRDDLDLGEEANRVQISSLLRGSVCNTSGY